MSSFSFVGVIFLRAVFFSSLSRSLDWSKVSFLFQCLKESYVKATGTGIGRDLQSVEFQINTKELSPQVCSAPTEIGGKVWPRFIQVKIIMPWVRALFN